MRSQILGLYFIATVERYYSAMPYDTLRILTYLIYGRIEFTPPINTICDVTF